MPARVVGLGRALVKGTRWQWLEAADLDGDGVVGDRSCALVDDRLRCLRTVQHPELLRMAPRAGDVGAASHRRPPVTVTYWGRPVRAWLVESSWADHAGRQLGLSVHLARAVERPGFVWDEAVSVVFTSDLEGLPREGTQLARYRPNVVVDDAAAPLRVAPGTVMELGPVQLECRAPIERCTVINHDPSKAGRKDRLFQRLPDRHLGWGCRVLSAGHVSCGTSAAVTSG